MLVPSLDRFLSIEIRWRRNAPREQSDEDRRPHRLAAHGVLKRRSSAWESWPALEWARGFRNSRASGSATSCTPARSKVRSALRRQSPRRRSRRRHRNRLSTNRTRPHRSCRTGMKRSAPAAARLRRLKEGRQYLKEARRPRANLRRPRRPGPAPGRRLAVKPAGPMRDCSHGPPADLRKWRSGHCRPRPPVARPRLAALRAGCYCAMAMTFAPPVGQKLVYWRGAAQPSGQLP